MNCLAHSDLKKDAICDFLNEHLIFKPINYEISFSVQADSTGPKQEQRIFFLKIQENYALLIQKVIPLIETELSIFQGRNRIIKISSFQEEFQLVGIDIPQIGFGPVVWELVI